MPVASSTTSAEPVSAEYSSAAAMGRRRWGFRRLLGSVLRIADLQYRIWLTRAKIVLIHAAMFAGLFAVAMVLGILAVIFLYIGVFHVLTDVAGLRPVWAFLIFGGGNLLLAGILVWIGVAMLSARDKPESHPSSASAANAGGKGAGQ